mmetsp:Transcript_15888/g.34382  ORF Transcript_15888/g.34382 Transcript_15888/m.34382 type:complete len:505 (-) Transcript_15888:107-1621(-)|eukprot:CAMPEP_0172308830 /NCGR_PEP_ID=MMETSP1058-20130122/9311_1 /TAXON_ID=83371 /ORGANISM="Detonula confervacea, Strain CCMP 353" /LENGTH=504 /DNA_ID=CAMNT_0013021339 /DNA_START=100 /DNA_END=1614 /DNA_ORIENTATION=+
MPKVSKIKAPAAGRKGLVNRRAAQQDDPEEADLHSGDDNIVDPADQFKDADDQFKDAEDVMAPSLPPMKADSPSPSVEKGSGDDDQEGNADDGDGFAGNKVPAEDMIEDTPTKLSPASPPPSLANDFRGGQESWNAMLYQLLLYKAQRGDLNIPHNDTSYRLLHNWVQTQRKHYKLYQDNKTSSTFLNADRIAVLDAIDFQWNVRGETFWLKNFESLIGYKTEHGDVRVPRLYAKNPKLGEWVTDQRRQWKSKTEGKANTMTEERKTKLDELGFVWKVRDRADWNDRYEQLLEFKKENGHCIVPQHYSFNRSLGKWVAKQREQYRFYREGKHSFLTEERIDLLKSVEFVWQIKGRGVNKKQLAKSPTAMSIDTEERDKSLAKVEEEDMAKQDAMAMSISDLVKLKSPPLLGGMESASAKSNVDQQIPSLPAITHQQLLPANMAAIAAHASSNQNMVADLAAALRFGGVNPNQVPLGDPRAVAALRAAQLGGDPNNPRSFSSHMI